MTVKPKKDEEELSSGPSEDDEMDQQPVAQDAQMESGDNSGEEDDDDDDEDDEEEADDDDDGGDIQEEKEVYIPGKSALAEDEELVMDKSAYHLYQHATTSDPCLSFSILKDELGDNRAEVFPLAAYLVAGTQAETHAQNHLLCMKMFNMHRVTENPDADDSEEEDEPKNPDGVDRKPKLNVVHVPHHGAVNRVRVQDINDKRICASWSDQGSVYLTDLTDAVKALEKAENISRFVKNKMAPRPFFKFSGHKTEGFAMDWSPVSTGYLATGDCNKNIHVWKPSEGGQWRVDERSLIGHTASVEDIQWSPNEATVFVSCSVDRSIRVFDIRVNQAKACMMTVPEAHESDVNVISWNQIEQSFLLSGGDDGALKVWDLRQFATHKPVSVFDYHKKPITSVEWHPTDGTVFTASSEDDCVTLWDLAIERDQAEPEEAALQELPPQLLFTHQGQKEVKECHWHPQLPGVLLSTSLSGFNVFRTISV